MVLDKIEVLGLSKINIDKTTVDWILQLPSLKSLSASKDRILARDRERLENKLPDVEFIWRK